MLKPEFHSAICTITSDKGRPRSGGCRAQVGQLQEWLAEADLYDRPERRIKCFLRFVAAGSEEIALSISSTRQLSRGSGRTRAWRELHWPLSLVIGGDSGVKPGARLGRYIHRESSLLTV